MTPLTCQIGQETYELLVDESGNVHRIIRYHPALPPEHLNEQDLGPYVSDRVNARIMHYLRTSQRQTRPSPE